MLPEKNFEMVKDAVTMILIALGEDPSRDGLRDTPRRVAEMYGDVLDGNFVELPKMTAFKEEKQDVSAYNIIVVKHAPFYGFCEHHLAVFSGTVSIGYVPAKRILGLSKLVRIFRYYAKRISIQERITVQAVEKLMEIAQPKGAIVHVVAEHTCMSLRGIKSPGAKTSTTAYKGLFEDNPAYRQQFMHEIGTNPGGNLG